MLTFSSFRVATSENGWTDDEVGFEWFKEVFVPQAVERNQVATEKERADSEMAIAREKDQEKENTAENSDVGQGESGEGSGEAVDESSEELEALKLTPILLIYDGHGSHTTLDWITLARSKNIILYCLPPHTTHRLQPLDVGCFGPLQIAWFNRCDEILDETGEGMEMKEVVTEYFVARRKAFKSENILKAWKNSGLRPLNPNLFTAADFAPSHSSSTQCHAPSSFPSKMPHVPDASSDDGMFDPAVFQNVIEVTNNDSASSADDSSQGDNSSDSDSSVIDADEEIEYTRQHASILASEHFRQIDAAHHAESSAMESGSDSDSDSETDNITFPGQSSLGPHTITTPTQMSPRYTRREHHKNLAQISRTPSTSTMPTSAPEPAAVTEDLHEAIRCLKRELQHVESERDAARVHAVFADRHAAVFQYRFNKKQAKLNQVSSRIHTKSRVVTNDQGLEEAKEHWEKKNEKKQKAAEKQARKAAKEKEDLVRRAVQGSTRVFIGSLSSKNKTELEDIGDALALDISGTKSILVARINEYFDEHPRFKEDPRFSGIFERSRGRKRPAPVDENQLNNSLPQAQTPSESTHIGQRRRLHSPPPSLHAITNTVHPPAVSFQLEPTATSSQVRLEDLSQVPTSLGRSDFYSNFGPPADSGGNVTTYFNYNQSHFS